MRTFGLNIMLLAALISFGFSIAPEEAQARRRGIPIFIFINTGETMYPVAPLPRELSEVPELSGWQLGYKCSRFGLFWADIWSWDRELVFFNGNSYMEIPEPIKEELQERYSFSAAQRNVWNKYGAFVMLGGILLMGYMKMRRRREETLPEEGLVQERGTRAVE